jgi:hypothetical protein
MLAPIIIELLIASLLFLLIGWAIDFIHASTRGSPRQLQSDVPIDSHHVRRLRKPLRDEGPEATWIAGPASWHQTVLR